MDDDMIEDVAAELGFIAAVLLSFAAFCAIVWWLL